MIDVPTEKATQVHGESCVIQLSDSIASLMCCCPVGDVESIGAGAAGHNVALCGLQNLRRGMLWSGPE